MSCKPILMLVLLTHVLVLASGCPNNENNQDPDPPNTMREDMSEQDSDMGVVGEDMDETTTEDMPGEDMSGLDPDMAQEAAPRLSPDAGCQIAETPNRSVKPGTELMRVTLDAPLALCNDGSPGVFYIRPGQGSGVDKWVIWLEGGGGCTDGESCAKRWCGRNIPTTAAKMSSKWAPAGIEGTGIFDHPEGFTNDFADWNHVVAYYCSSDSWAGRITHPELNGPQGSQERYSLILHGKYILNAILDELEQGATSDDGNMQLPSVDDATTILFSGTSAGGGGARLNADDVRERLLASNPDVDFRLVVDAGVWTKDPDEFLTEEESAAFFANSYDISTNFRNTFTDASCLAYHTDDPEKCAEPTHILLDHTETPFFIKMDYNDNVDSPGIYANDEEFARSTYALLQEVAAGDYTPEEASAQRAGGVFATNCAHHVALESSDFYKVQVSDGAQSLSFHDLVSNWFSNTTPTSLLDDRGDAFTSVCNAMPSTMPSVDLPTSPGRHDVALDHDGTAREVHVVLPTGFDANASNTLVVVFHGASARASDFADSRASLRELANQRGWVLAFPQGLDNASNTSSWSWASPPIADEWAATPPDDAGFALRFIDSAITQWGVNTDAVFLAGFSKGGRMVHHLAALYPGRFAAAAITSSSIGATFVNDPMFYYTPATTGALPVMLVHGLVDPQLPYEGSASVSPFSESVDRWRQANGCNMSPMQSTTGEVRTDAYMCSGAPLRAVSIQSLAHKWAEASDGFGWTMSEATVDFFTQNLP